MVDINIQEITPNIYNNLDKQRKNKVLKLLLIQEARRYDVIWNTNNPNYVTKGGAMYTQEFKKITRTLKNRLSPKLTITKLKNEWQNTRKAYVFNFNENHDNSTYKFREELQFLNQHIMAEQLYGPFFRRRGRAPNRNLRPVEAVQVAVQPERVEDGIRVEAAQGAANVEQYHIPARDFDEANQILVQGEEVVQDLDENGDPNGDDVVHQIVEELHAEYINRNGEIQIVRGPAQIDELVNNGLVEPEQDHIPVGNFEEAIQDPVQDEQADDYQHDNGVPELDPVNRVVADLHADYVDRQRRWQIDLDRLVNELFE